MTCLLLNTTSRKSRIDKFIDYLLDFHNKLWHCTIIMEGVRAKYTLWTFNFYDTLLHVSSQIMSVKMNQVKWEEHTLGWNCRFISFSFTLIEHCVISEDILPLFFHFLHPSRLLCLHSTQDICNRRLNSFRQPYNCNSRSKFTISS